MVHIWHEDNQNSATTSFWDFLYKNRVSPKLTNVSIKGFGGNQKLADTVKSTKFNSKDTYIILVDKVLDNAKALKYYLDIQKIVCNYKNIYISDLLCFEYLILRFRYFEAWTEPIKAVKGYQDAKQIREKFIKCIDSGNSWTNEKDIINYVVKYKRINTSVPGWKSELNFVSSENLATLLLSMMTNGGKTNFGVSKTCLGNCWTCSCCVKYNNRLGNNSCKIYKYKKTALEKAKNLWNGTLAKQIVNNAI